MTQPELVAIAKQVAEKHLLDPAVVCAICEQESSWKQYAYRYEPEFEKRYVDPMVGLPPDEEYKRSCSFGLMQLMGECARELGYKDDLNGLFDPCTNLEYGCTHFKNKLARSVNLHDALQRWNGGGNASYAAEVIARIPKYQIVSG